MNGNCVKDYEPLILGHTKSLAGMSDTVTQVRSLKQAGCKRIIFGEDRFSNCLEELHAGDTLVACGLYALPCSLPEFVTFMNDCEDKGVGFCTLKEGDFVNTDLSNPDKTPQMKFILE